MPKFRVGDRVRTVGSGNWTGTIIDIQGGTMEIRRDDGEKGAGDHGGWVTTGHRIAIIDEQKFQKGDIVVTNGLCSDGSGIKGVVLNPEWGKNNAWSLFSDYVAILRDDGKKNVYGHWNVRQEELDLVSRETVESNPFLKIREKWVKRYKLESKISR